MNDWTADPSLSSPSGSTNPVRFNGPWTEDEVRAIQSVMNVVGRAGSPEAAHESGRDATPPDRCWMATKHAFPSFTLFVASHAHADTPLTAPDAPTLAGQMARRTASSAETAAQETASWPVFQLVYRSTATGRMDDAAVQDVLHKARAKNERLNVTGVLLFAAGHFLQVLEGEEATVRSLFNVIEQDPRHQNVEIVVTTRVRRRVFPDWTMGLENFENVETETDSPATTSFLTDGTVATDEAPLPVIAQALEQFKDVASSSGDAGPLPHESNGGYRLLVVEDNATTLRLLAIMFQGGAHTIDTAQTVDEALFKAEEHTYDAFILDINLSERRTGIEVLHAIRRMPQHDGVPAIACTAYALQAQQALFQDAGFSTVVTKPITKNRLMEGIERAMDDPLPDHSRSADRYEDMKLPPLPTTIPQLLTLVARGGHEETDYEKLIHLLSQDQVLATWLIQTANSAFFKLNARVDSVEAAIRYLGFRTACNLVLSKLLTERFRAFDTDREHQIYNYVMRLSLGAAYLARGLAKRVEHPHPEIAYSGVLLSQLGRLILLDDRRGEYASLWFERGAFAGPPLLGQETLFLSTSYIAAGAAAAHRYELPDRLQQVIRYHHRPADLPGRGEALLAHLVATALETYDEMMGRPMVDLQRVLLTSYPLEWVAERSGVGRRPLMVATRELMEAARAFSDEVLLGDRSA